MPTPSITFPFSHLIEKTAKEAFTRATRHPFLKAAGEGRISKRTLSQWLAQDRLYAQSYIRFIGLLLSKVVIPPCNRNVECTKEPTVEERVVDILIECLANIQQELHFFTQTADEFDLDLTACPEPWADDLTGGNEKEGRKRVEGKTVHLAGRPVEEQQQLGSNWIQTSGGGNLSMGNPVQSEAHGIGHPSFPADLVDPVVFGPSPITRAYIDLFISSGSVGSTLLEGMTVLFATEFCYLKAWKYAASVMEEASSSGSKSADTDADGGALRLRFIPNWTSPEFEKFVVKLQDITDVLANRLKGVEESETEKGKCILWWKQVLWLEEKFWPGVKC